MSRGQGVDWFHYFKETEEIAYTSDQPQQDHRCVGCQQSRCQGIGRPSQSQAKEITRSQGRSCGTRGRANLGCCRGDFQQHSSDNFDKLDRSPCERLETASATHHHDCLSTLWVVVDGDVKPTHNTVRARRNFNGHRKIRQTTTLTHMQLQPAYTTTTTVHAIGYPTTHHVQQIDHVTQYTKLRRKPPEARMEKSYGRNRRTHLRTVGNGHNVRDIFDMEEGKMLGHMESLQTLDTNTKTLTNFQTTALSSTSS